MLDYVIKCSADTDPATAKFACFAVGNSAFHSDALYSLLQTSVAPLTAALSSTDEKTRANAAGALGNLARNGSQLCKTIVNAGAVKKLILMVRDDVALSPQRIALFSIGTLASHTICRAEMGVCKPSASDLLRTLKQGQPESLSDTSTAAPDEALVKYATRLKAKLKQAASTVSRPSSGERVVSR